MAQNVSGGLVRAALQSEKKIGVIKCEFPYFLINMNQLTLSSCFCISKSGVFVLLTSQSFKTVS